MRLYGLNCYAGSLPKYTQILIPLRYFVEAIAYISQRKIYIFAFNLKVLIETMLLATTQ